MNDQSTEEEEGDFESVRVLRAMVALFTSAKRPWLLGLASLAVTFLSTIWFVMCFTGPGGWWSSIYWFLVFYGGAAILALRGIRSILGIAALFIAIVPFGLLLVYLFVLR